MSSINDIIKKLRENRILNERKDYEKFSRNELIKMAQDGDQLAIETLINTHQDFINMMSSKYILEEGDKDDVKQYVTIAFWDAIMHWDGSGDFEAYAGMIIKRKMADVLRSEDTGRAKISNRADKLEQPIASDGEGGEATLGASLANSGLTPEDQVVGDEGARELIKFMRDNLSKQERSAVMMYIKGYKVSEISEELGMKYKSVENALMRVKNKLADYLRTRESKKIRESKSIEFTDEEKQLLESIITRVNEQEALKESAASISEEKKLNTKIKEAFSDPYKNYTKEQLDDELVGVEYELENIIHELKYTLYSKRGTLENKLKSLSKKLDYMEEYLTDEQYKKSEELLGEIYTAKDTDYEGDEKEKYIDPYTERGLRRSDFY